MNFDKSRLLLYAVTSGGDSIKELERKVYAAICGGAKTIQLRDKAASRAELEKKTKALVGICRGEGAYMIVDDDYAAALEVGADGVHLGETDESVKKVRIVAGDNFIIGATAKTVERAVAVRDEGASYIGIGAFFPTSTKPEAKRMDATCAKEVISASRLPAVAIGGITAENAVALRGLPLAGLAVSSAIFSARDPRAAAEKLFAAANEMFGNKSSDY